MSFNRGLDTENVVHLHNGVLLSFKNDEFMKFLGKWMELENIILSEVTQSSYYVQNVNDYEKKLINLHLKSAVAFMFTYKLKQISKRIRGKKAK